MSFPIANSLPCWSFNIISKRISRKIKINKDILHLPGFRESNKFEDLFGKLSHVRLGLLFRTQLRNVEQVGEERTDIIVKGSIVSSKDELFVDLGVNDVPGDLGEELSLCIVWLDN